jgi:hypothetical protein
MGEKIGSYPVHSLHVLTSDGLLETNRAGDNLTVARPAISRDQCEDPRILARTDDLFGPKPAYPTRPGTVGPPPGVSPTATIPTAVLARAFGPSTGEQPALRAKIDEALRANKDKTFEALANDKKAMALMSPEEKAQAIRRLVQGRTNNREDRAILNYLESCKNRAEFDRVLELAGGGKKVLKELDHKDTFRKTLLVYQAWGRDDLVPPKWKNFVSQVPSGILLQPDGGGLDDLGQVPPRLGPHYGRPWQNLGDFEAASFDHHLLREIDPGTRVELIIENARRKSSGQPPLDYAGLLSALRRVSSDPALGDGQKKKQIEELRRSFGLSKNTMRDLGTGRLAGVTRTVKDELTSFYPVLMGQLQSRLAAAVRMGGEGSARAAEIRAQIAELASEAERRGQRLDGQAQQLDKLYRIRLGSGLFSKVLKVFDQVAPLLNLIPGFGQLAYAVYTGVKVAVAASKGNLMGALGAAARFAGPLGGAIGGSLGRIVSVSGKLISSGVAGARGYQALAQGNIAGGLAAIGGAFDGAGSTLGVSPRLLDAVNKGVSLGTKIATAAQGIASGDYTRVLAGVRQATELAGLENAVLDRQLLGNVTVRDVLAHSDQGARLFRQIREGEIDKALGTLHRELAGWAPIEQVDQLVRSGQRELIDRGQVILNKPEVRKAFTTFERFAPFVQAAATGRYSESLARLAELEPLNRVRDRLLAARTAAEQFEPAFHGIAAELLRELAGAPRP